MIDNLIKPFCELQSALNIVRETVALGTVPVASLPWLDAALVAYLKAMNADRARLIGEGRRAEQELEKKESALKIAGEELRAVQELNRSYARQLAGTEENPALMTILGALVDAQRIMTDWLVPDGVRARDTVRALLPVLDNQTLVLAMREFEKPRNDRG